MSFVTFTRLENQVWACQLKRDTQHDIADMVSSSVTLGQLANLRSTLNDDHDCLEYEFRYKDSTGLVYLRVFDWLVQMPNGRLLVMTNQVFVQTYIDKNLDYIVPQEKQKTFEQALLAYINLTFPELYMGNQISSITPYVNLVPESATTMAPLTTILDGSTVIVHPIDKDVETGASLKSCKVTVTLPEPVKLTKYLISMPGDSYNALKSWSVEARNTTDGMVRHISTITGDDVKPGFYTPQEAFIADEYTFTIAEFEQDTEIVKGFRIALTTGGEFIEVQEPKPFEKFTLGLLETVAEKLNVWYDSGTDTYTISLPTYGIVDSRGISSILPILLKASFITPSTGVILSFPNNKITDERVPNQFDSDDLDTLTYELMSLTHKDRQRIIGMDFSALCQDTPSAICKSVNAHTDVLWRKFVDFCISYTGIMQPGQIKK